MSRVGLTRLTADCTSRDPHVYWALGLMTLLPGRLVAFVGLLGSEAGQRPQLVAAVAWVLSAAAGLIGAIATEARVRGVGESAEVHHGLSVARPTGPQPPPRTGPRPRSLRPAKAIDLLDRRSTHGVELSAAIQASR